MPWPAASIRFDTASRLMSYNTIAGGSVEQCRATDVPVDELPFLGVHTQLQEDQVQSEAGTEPRFDAKLHLTIEAKVAAVPLANSVAQLDTLVGQVTDGLLSDPEWWIVNQITRVSSMSIRTGFKSEGETFVGQAEIALVIEYVERFPMRGGAPLSFVDLTTTVGDQRTGAAIAIPAN